LQKGDEYVSTSRWHKPTIVFAVAFAGFSATHLIDDFLANVPLEFNLTVPVTLLLALAYMIALVGLVAAASSHSRTGYLGLAIVGLLISSAQFAKSLPEMLLPGPWRLGLSSELHAVGLTISGVLMMITSFLAWREGRIRVEGA
jgi:hypothetical protein